FPRSHLPPMALTTASPVARDCPALHRRLRQAAWRQAFPGLPHCSPARTQILPRFSAAPGLRQVLRLARTVFLPMPGRRPEFVALAFALASAAHFLRPLSSF